MGLMVSSSSLTTTVGCLGLTGVGYIVGSDLAVITTVISVKAVKKSQ
jgi:hypothetical protein